MNVSIDEILEVAKRIAKLGGDHTLNYFNKTYTLEFKNDKSPVTSADREAEQLMRKHIQELYPEHGIIGEEFGLVNEGSSIQWILDPIDGTKSFIHGVPLYTTLIGVLIDGKPEVGVIYNPATGELCDAATGRGTRLNDVSCSVRECNSLEEATILTTEIENVEEYGFIKGYNSLRSKCRLHRTWGDAYGHMLVATGRADIMFDPILNIWDAAPLYTIITEAGGSYTNAFGEIKIETGQSGVSSNKTLAPMILEHFIK